MINFDDFKNKTKHNLKWACIPDHPYRILIIGGPASGKTNASLNSINNQLDIDKIYLYAKDPYQFLINKRERAGIKHFNDPKAFIEYSMMCKKFIAVAYLAGCVGCERTALQISCALF